MKFSELVEAKSKPKVSRQLNSWLKNWGTGHDWDNDVEVEVYPDYISLQRTRPRRECVVFYEDKDDLIKLLLHMNLTVHEGGNADADDIKEIIANARKNGHDYPEFAAIEKSSKAYKRK